jgi:hypothetical protein
MLTIRPNRRALEVYNHRRGVESFIGRGSGPPADRKFVRVRLPPTGTLFLFGIVVGVVTPLRLSVLLAGARRSASRGSAARRAAARFHHEMAFKNRARDTRLEHQRHVDTATSLVRKQTRC